MDHDAGDTELPWKDCRLAKLAPNVNLSYEDKSGEDSQMELPGCSQ